VIVIEENFKMDSSLFSIILLSFSISLVNCCNPVRPPSPPNPPPNPWPNPNPNPNPGSGGTKNVLWLGNSYTNCRLYNIPQMVQELGNAAGTPISYDLHAPGGWRLQNHVNSGVSNNKIRSRKWDVVILQEQSQMPCFPQVCSETIPSLKSLERTIRANNPSTTIQLYGTWGRPSERDWPNQACLSQRYKAFTCMTSKPSRMAPVGDGFKRYGEKYGSQAKNGLFDQNGADHHASTKGAYLSACMHYLAINGPGSTVVGNSYSGGLGAGTARQIQEVAQEVWNNGDGWDYATDGTCNESICNSG